MFRPTNPLRSNPAPPQDPRDKQAYMPPNIEQAMKKEQGEEQIIQPGAVSQPAPVVAPDPAVAPGPVVTAAPLSPDQPYAFITNPEAPPKQSSLASLPGANSIVTRVGLVAGGLLVLLIIFLVIKGIFSGSGLELTSLITVAQDQQEIIHLATNAGQEQSLSAANQNFAATVQASMSSAQSQLIGYLASNNKKINDKQLNLKVSASLDSQLTSASSAGTYNQSFQPIMQTELATYEKDLQQAYGQDKGQHGRALLDDFYHQAQLMATQLNSPTS